MKNTNIYFSPVILFLVLLMSSFNSFSQTRICSPYSRYGVGDVQNNKNYRNMSMGGIGYALRSPYSVNFSNPASYSAFDSSSFVFETGGQSNFVKLETSKLSENSNYTSLSYLLFGFPIMKNWSSSIGLLPFSNVGYKISDNQIDTNIACGNINYLYEGTGGFNQFYLGNGFKIFKDLSVGFNISYLFGAINYIQTITFDSSSFINVRQQKSIIPNDIYFNLGMQYGIKIKDNLMLDLGVVFNNATEVNSRRNTLVERFETNTTATIIDTIENESIKGNVVLPISVGFGVLLTKAEKWRVGIDYQWQKWSEYSSFGEKDLLDDGNQIAFGAEFAPNSNSSSYWKKIYYRFGFRYNQTYLNLNKTPLDEFGTSFGFGLPLRRTKSTINLGFEFGRRGTTDNNLIQEQFGRISIGLSVYEKWFMKRKFD